LPLPEGGGKSDPFELRELDSSSKGKEDGFISPRRPQTS
jgi:hypothetical protein